MKLRVVERTGVHLAVDANFRLSALSSTQLFSAKNTHPLTHPRVRKRAVPYHPRLSSPRIKLELQWLIYLFIIFTFYFIKLLFWLTAHGARRTALSAVRQLVLLLTPPPQLLLSSSPLSSFLPFTSLSRVSDEFGRERRENDQTTAEATEHLILIV